MLDDSTVSERGTDSPRRGADPLSALPSTPLRGDAGAVGPPLASGSASAAGSAAGTPSGFSRHTAAGRSSRGQTPRASGKVLRSYLRGDVPRRAGRETEVQFVHEAVSCVERNDMERLNTLLEEGHVDVNATDGDGHTLLDLAVMLNQHGCVRLLQLFGGVETEACQLL